MDLQRIMHRIRDIRKTCRLQDGNDTVVLVVRRCTQLCLPRGPHHPSWEPALLARLVAEPSLMRIPKSSLEFMGSGRPAH